MKSNKPAATPHQLQEMHAQAEWLLKDARRNLRAAKKHLDIYNRCVPTEFPDEEDSGASERWDLDNLLEGLPEMERSLLDTCRRFVPGATARLAPVRVKKMEKASNEERRLANIKLAKEQMYEMHSNVARCRVVVHELFMLGAIPYAMESNVEKLERIAEFYWRKTYQQNYFYAQH